MISIYFTDNFLFNTIFKNKNIGKTNKIDPYSLLIDIFKAMTNHMEDNYCLEDIMEVREFFTKKIIESMNKAASVLIDSNNNDSKF